MRDMDSATAQAFAADATTLCHCWRLTRRDGAVLRGSGLTRRFHFGELDVEVEEVLALDLPVRAVLYERIGAARDFELETDVPYRTNGRTIMFQPRSYPSRIRISYRL